MIAPNGINPLTAALFGGALLLALLMGIVVGPGAGLAFIALGLLATVVADFVVGQRSSGTDATSHEAG
jgi:hypothetical protein